MTTPGTPAGADDHAVPATGSPESVALPGTATPATTDRSSREPEPVAAEPGPGPGPAHGPGSLRALLRYFLVLGTVGFGGPIATVGYMQRDLVEQRGWLDREEFLNGVALGQTMPGPLAAQVSMWVGFLQQGAFGALAVAIAFIAPSFLFVLAVAALYAHFSGLPVVQAVFYGVAPGVMAIIAIAAYKLARLTNRTDLKLWTITAVIAVVTAVTGTEVALLFLAAGLLMIVLEAPPRWLRRPTRAASFTLPAFAPLAKAMTAGTLGVLATGGTLIALALFFLKAGAFIFGSGLAIVPFLREGVVTSHHWLNNRQFLDAVAIGLITPGPVVITATFIGYLVGGLSGAIVATIAIFLPIYFGVVLPGRWFLRHKDNPQVKAFVRGAAAAAAGAIAGATVVLTQGAVTDLTTAAIALATLGVLLRYKVKEPYVVLACAALGIALH